MYKEYTKRIFDLIFSLLLMPLFLIISIVIAPIVYFEDRGTVFYVSSRLGKNGKIFRMYKFRTMKMNSPDIRNNDSSTFSSEDDPRLTKIGMLIRKTSIDEIPQLLNVIKGEMSIVGPRPDLPEAIGLYTPYEKRKLEVRPGITGYNQAFFRNSVSSKEKFVNDIYYVDKISFALDTKIILKTICSVIKRKSIYSSSSNSNKGEAKGESL